MTNFLETKHAIFPANANTATTMYIPTGSSTAVANSTALPAALSITDGVFVGGASNTLTSATGFTNIIAGDVLSVASKFLQVARKVDNNTLELFPATAGQSFPVVGTTGITVNTTTTTSCPQDGYLQNPARNALAPARFGMPHRVSILSVYTAYGTSASAVTDYIALADSSPAVIADFPGFTVNDTGRSTLFLAAPGTFGVTISKSFGICFRVLTSLNTNPGFQLQYINRSI